LLIAFLTSSAFLDDIITYVPDFRYQPQNYAHIMKKYNGAICNVTIIVRNGNPVEVQSGGITVRKTTDLLVTEWVVEDSLKLYNPIIIKAREKVPPFISNNRHVHSCVGFTSLFKKNIKTSKYFHCT